ncbi:MAG: hypothetical protein IPM29_15795 [Planctomycetes bacterium]|nr:hypothetical protein [Planctomycetota bacterium]
MALDRMDGVDLLLMTGGYWLVDLATRRDGVVRLLRRVGLRTDGAIVATLVALGAALAVPWRWSDVPQGVAVRVLALALAVLLTWKAATRDIDPVFGDRDRVARWGLVVATAGAFVSPALLLPVAVLLSYPFALWEHHATLPMRVLIAVVTWLCGAGLSAALAGPGADRPFTDTAGLAFFVLTIQISHYIITALAKIWLGPHWYSWVKDNRLHHLAASAYSWGWARFLPWRTWRRAIRVLKVVERPMQLYAFTIELLAPLALLHRDLGIAFCVGWAAFHLGVFAVSGLLFWDWVTTNLAVAAMLLLLPAAVTDQVFGVWPTLVAIVYMVAFPLRHRLWKPIPLGWWDTPFTQRMHWRAHGRSGAVYGLHNDFMCPNERLYGKVHACFLAPARGITYHLGEVWKHELRDAIRAAGPDLARLEGVRERFGIEPRDEALAQNHVAYLKRFFHALNGGARKRVLPRALRWLKAPGDQVFYWGELPRFRGQEEVVRVSLHYREEYFDGDELRRLRDDHVMTIEIDASAAQAVCCPEPTPKQIDELLLRYANGRIIDLPGFNAGYVESDDGKVRG